MLGTLLILGNGFDLDLGWKTRYSDFGNSNYWPRKRYPLSHLQRFLTGKKGVGYWFDLEQCLLDYCSRSQGYVERNGIHENIEMIEADKAFFLTLQRALRNYLIHEQMTSVNVTSCAALLLGQLIRESKKLENIFSFNYTDIKEICNGLNLKLPTNIDTIHVHGSLSKDDIILGVDDSEVSEGYEFMQKTVSINYESTNILSSMAACGEVIIFGHSLGKVDEEYFRPFFEHVLKQNIQDVQYHPRITIFTYDESSRVSILRRISQMGINRQRLFSFCDFKIYRTKEDQEEIRRYILKRELSSSYAINSLINANRYL